MKATKTIFLVVAALVLTISPGVQGRNLNRRRRATAPSPKGKKDKEKAKEKETRSAPTPTAWKQMDDIDWEDVGPGGSDRGDESSWIGANGSITLTVDPDLDIEPFEVPEDRSSPDEAPKGPPKGKKCTDPLC